MKLTVANMSHRTRLRAAQRAKKEAMAKNDFDAPGAIKRVEDDNAGVNFDNKVKEAVCRSTYVQDEVKKVVWALLKEKILWVVGGAFSYVALGLLAQLFSKLISKI